jgi:hypothetical protein
MCAQRPASQVRLLPASILRLPGRDERRDENPHRYAIARAWRLRPHPTTDTEATTYAYALTFDSLQAILKSVSCVSSVVRVGGCATLCGCVRKSNVQCRCLCCSSYDFIHTKKQLCMEHHTLQSQKLDSDSDARTSHMHTAKFQPKIGLSSAKCMAQCILSTIYHDVIHAHILRLLPRPPHRPMSMD